MPRSPRQAPAPVRGFRGAMGRFLEDPGALGVPTAPLLTELIRSWGNAAWSAREGFLAACVSHALAARGPILECGSGLSTLLVGAIAQRRGLAHWVLEHDPAWAGRARAELEALGLDSVVLCREPLRDYGDFCWYDPPLAAMPRDFALVVCDGPPGRTRGGRFGLVPVMGGRFRPGCVILLDDAHREPERLIAGAWAAALGAALALMGPGRPYLRLQTPE